MNRHNGIISAILFLVIIVLVAIFLSSCNTSEQTPSKSSGKPEAQRKTAAFPKKTFIDDYEVRIVPDKVSYPTELPVLSAKREDFTEKEIIGWFTGERGKANRVKRKDVIVPHFGGPYGPVVQSEDPDWPKLWQITGEELGVLELAEDGGLSFGNPFVTRSYGVIPKGETYNSKAKLVFIRDAIPREEAVEKAEAYVKAHGGIPDDAEQKVVAGDSGVRIIKDGKEIDPVGKTLWYSVQYKRRYSGIPVESNSIEVDIDALGVARYTRNWHDVKGVGTPKPVISPKEAIKAAVSEYAPAIYSRKGVVVSQVRLIYRPVRDENGTSSATSTLQPVWFIRMTAQEVLVNAYTGEVLGLVWDTDEERARRKAMKQYEKFPLSDKIPVPQRISFIGYGREIFHLDPTDKEFGPFLKEAQNILSKMRPYWEKKADMHGASADTPKTSPYGGILLEFDGKERLVTDSKIGRDIDKKDLPESETERRMNYTKDGYYRIYAHYAFISFNDSGSNAGQKPRVPDDSYVGPLTKVLTTRSMGSAGYVFTSALTSNEKLMQMAYDAAPQEYIQSILRSSP